MNTITDELAERLKAEAIAARRAARAPWQNAHADRLAREREARCISKEYQQAQREAGSKQCATCREIKPASCFEALPTGNLRATCKHCRADRRAERREERLAPEKAAKEAAREAEQAAAREAELVRRRKVEDRKRGIRKRPLSAERLREVAEEVDHLSSLLLGTHPTERITNQQSWEATASELQRLWLQSGDKVCVSCKQTVQPTAMLPPGPANFYPGRCRKCALAEYRERSLRVFGWVACGPPTIQMRDGTHITVAELARRVRERCNPSGLSILIPTRPEAHQCDHGE